MTIQRAREILWDLVADLSDEKMEDIVNLSKRFANIVLDYAEKKCLELE